MPKDLHAMTAQELREEVDRLSSAIQRARSALEGRRTADAVQILNVACPRLVMGDGKGGKTQRRMDS